MSAQSSLTIRNAEVKDADLLLAAEQYHATEPGFLVSKPEELILDNFKNKISHLINPENGIYVVGELDGKVVAHGVLERMNLQALSHIMRLTLVTHHGHQKKGIGKGILGYLIDWAKKSGVTKIELLVREVNWDAVRLYRSFGFVREGVLRRRIRDDDRFLDDITMALFLDEPTSTENIKGDHGTLVYFPWIKISEPVCIEDLEFFPYSKNRKAEFPLEVVKVMDSIKHGGGRTQNSAVVVKFRAKPNFEVISEDDRQYLFDMSELIALAALSERKFFRHTDYFNRDNYQLNIQGFSKGADFAALSSRRRDGDTTGVWPYDLYELRCPPHVKVCKVSLESPSLTALISAYKSPLWTEKYSDAIRAFNGANTDDSKMSDRIEVVQMVGAFERLYQLKSGKAADFASALVSHLNVTPAISTDKLGRLSNNENIKKGNAVKSVWAYDIYQTRNHHAHGNEKPNAEKIWKLKEHLLLSTYLFPVAVKVELARDGFYALTDEDRQEVFTFDHIATKPSLFLEKPQYEEYKEFPWVEAERDAFWDWKIVNLPPGP